MKRVYICSQLSGYVVSNIKRAEQLCAWALVSRGVSPFAPHAFYTIFLDDEVSEERDLGVAAGDAWLEGADEVWVFVVDGVISGGMNKEVLRAIDLGIPVYWHAITADLSTIRLLTHLPTNEIPCANDLMLNEVLAENVQQVFANTEKHLKAGLCYADLSEDIDKILGTGLEDRDIAAEETWEECYRGSNLSHGAEP